MINCILIISIKKLEKLHFKTIILKKLLNKGEFDEEYLNRKIFSQLEEVQFETSKKF